MFALVDANSFYCSAEQVFRPEWRGKPIVVLSNNDGCVVAANRQAKECGVDKFKPYFQMKALLANFCWLERKSVLAVSRRLDSTTPASSPGASSNEFATPRARSPSF